ncbi:MAG: hypothetical protein IPM37_19935 [Hahellaceae bacterium]|jgi:hypothetical protein|nr:hypothetical protein [Hahellaceae bacterium]
MVAIFEGKDLPYNGIDRRQQHRRQSADRRDSVRFEPGKSDRRRSSGRRKGERGGWNDVIS